MLSDENIKNDYSKWYKSGSVSVLIHILGFFLIAALAKFSFKGNLINPVFYSVEFNERIISQNVVEKNNLRDEQIKQESSPDEVNQTEQFFFTDIEADTTNLDQVYRENSLNVSIKFPKGWTFIDQNVKNKLDGVTFWALDGVYNPPPYIHLEVKEKYYFIESKYKYRIELDNYIAFYNDPEIIEGYVTQIVYLRTKTEEDFSLKLMMSDEEAFRSFQPRFFGMIKTFNFGKAFF